MARYRTALIAQIATALECITVERLSRKLSTFKRARQLFQSLQGDGTNPPGFPGNPPQLPDLRNRRPDRPAARSARAASQPRRPRNQKSYPRHDALEHPFLGATRVGQELRLRAIQVTSGGGRSIWQRNELLTKLERPLCLEKTTPERKGELSVEQIRLLERFAPELRERRSHLCVVEHSGPFRDDEIGRHDDRGPFVEPDDGVQEQLPARLSEGQVPLVRRGCP